MSSMVSTTGGWRPGGRPRPGQGHRHLDGGQRGAGISLARGHHGGDGVGLGLGPLELRGRAGPGCPGRRRDKRVEPPQRGPAQQGRIHLEERVLRGGPDEHDQPVFDGGEEHVLLGLGEAVHLVDEEHGAPAPARPGGARPRPAPRARPSRPPRWPTSVTRCLAVLSARRRASVVLPVPAGPHRMHEPTRSDSASARNGAPGPTRCCWPTTSSRVRGRRRAARGAWRAAGGRRRRRRGSRARRPGSAARAEAARSGRPRAAPRRGCRARPGWPRAAGSAHRSAGRRPTGSWGRRSPRGCSPRRPARRPAGPRRRRSRRGAGRRSGRRRGGSRSGPRPPRVDAERGEHLLLDVAAVDTDAPRAELPPVEDEVVGLGAHRRAGRWPTGAGPRGTGMVKGWCAACGLPSAPTPSNMGKSTTQT